MHWCGCEACGPGCGEAREAGRARDEAPGGDDYWRVALAECAATALLVLLTCTATCAPSAAASPLQRSVASGFVVALLVQVPPLIHITHIACQTRTDFHSLLEYSPNKTGAKLETNPFLRT